MKPEAITDEGIQNPLVRKAALNYFKDRYIIGNLPRAPISQLDSECHIWTAGKKGKYGVYSMSINNCIYRGQAHRLSYQLFIGPIGGLLVLHVCQEELCVNPSHLMLGDGKLNKLHQLKNKKAPTHPHLKHVNDLITEDVKMIRTLAYKHKYPISILCEMYKKSYTCIYNIINYNSWKI
jgi:hypothetical protein